MVMHASITCHIYAGVDGAAEGEGHAALAGSRFGDLLCDIAPGLGWGLAVAWSPSGLLSLATLQAIRHPPLARMTPLHGLIGRGCSVSLARMQEWSAHCNWPPRNFWSTH